MSKVEALKLVANYSGKVLNHSMDAKKIVKTLSKENELVGELFKNRLNRDGVDVGIISKAIDKDLLVKGNVASNITAKFLESVKKESFWNRLKRISSSKINSLIYPEKVNSQNYIQKVRTKSVPTQEAIEKSFPIDFAKMEEANRVGGYYDRTKVKDALAGFTHGTKVEPVTTTSRKTIDVINEMNNVEKIEALAKAEATGTLAPETLARRSEIFDTFYSA